MKKKFFVLLIVFQLLFAVTGSVFAASSGTGITNTSQQPQMIQQFFFDITKNHWAFNVIQDMKQWGIINGDSDGNFYPERQVTRAEFATMLTRGLHLSVDVATYQIFTDVPQSYWAYKYIEAAKPYLTSYQNPEGQLYYNPKEPAIREDIIVAMVRAKHFENEQSDLTLLSKFVDSDKIPDNLKGYVAIAVKHDLVKGSVDRKGQYHLYPQGKLTRAEAAAFLHRLV